MVKPNDRFDESAKVRGVDHDGSPPERARVRAHQPSPATGPKGQGAFVADGSPRKRRRIAIRRLTEHPQFYLTAPSPCPYLPDRFERKVFTHLVGERAAGLNDILTQGGFRRSQNIAYRPACEGCRACVSVRVVVDEFRWTRSLRRVKRANGDLERHERPALPSSEQYSVFRGYLDSRHAEGGMADMTVLDYAMMVEDTHVDTRMFEYRTAGSTRGRGPLMGCALTDVLADGLSMVYSFYEPDRATDSVGTFMILDHVARAAELGLPYVYLGYWVRGSDKMGYKARFQPQEHLGPNGWVRS